MTAGAGDMCEGLAGCNGGAGRELGGCMSDIDRLELLNWNEKRPFKIASTRKAKLWTTDNTHGSWKGSLGILALAPSKIE